MFWRASGRIFGVISVCVVVRRGALLTFAALPVDESVDVVDKKHDEAKDHGEIRGVGQGGENPKHDKHDVVGGIGECVVGTAQKRESGGQNAGSNRQRTEQ